MGCCKAVSLRKEGDWGVFGRLVARRRHGTV